MTARVLDDRVRNSYHLGMKTTVSEKGQITIPKRLRDRLGLRPGTILDFEEDRGRLVGRKLAAVATEIRPSTRGRPIAL